MHPSVIDDAQASIAVSFRIPELPVGHDPGVIPEEESQIMTGFFRNILSPEIEIEIPASLFLDSLIVAEFQPVISLYRDYVHPPL